MPSSYPGGLDTFATNKANATAAVDDHPPHHNDLADAVNKVEAELGTEPSGSAATVKARLDAVHDVPVGAEPAAPSAGLLRIYAEFRAQRALLHTKGPSGLAVGIQPAVFQNTIRGVFPGTASSPSTIGGTIFTTGGTINHPAPTATSFGYATNYASPATANAASGQHDSNSTFLRGDGTAGQASGWFFVTRFWIPAAGDLVNSGMVAGMTSSLLANMTAAADPSVNHYAMLSQHDAAGDSRATKFGFQVRNTGTPVLVDTGIVPAADTLYDFYMFSPPYAGSSPALHMRLEDLSNNVVFDHTFPGTEAQLPAAATVMRSFVGCLTTENVVKNIRVKKLYVESDW